AADELRLLRDLLLADAHGAPLLGPLEQVALEARLELLRGTDGRGCQAGEGYPTASRLAAATRSSGRNGFDSTPSARLRSSSTSALPVTSTTGRLLARSSSRSAWLDVLPRWTSRKT